MTVHRVEIVRRVPSERYELWRSDDRGITLRRARTESSWYAVLDGTPVPDMEVLDATEGNLVENQECLLVAKSARGLAELLAMQEHVHILFQE